MKKTSNPYAAKNNTSLIDGDSPWVRVIIVFNMKADYVNKIIRSTELTSTDQMRSSKWRSEKWSKKIQGLFFKVA